MSTCFCIGPINGNPYCPCRMKALGEHPYRKSEPDFYSLDELKAYTKQSEQKEEKHDITSKDKE